ncbi:hypothetical protein ACWGB8_33035 [Kitasatospora sp. NPDC054939]
MPRVAAQGGGARPDGSAAGAPAEGPAAPPPAGAPAGASGTREAPADAFGHARLGELCRRLAAAATGGGPAGSGGPGRTGAGLPRLGAEGADLLDRLLAELRAGRTAAELDDLFDELEEELLMAGHSAGLGSYRSTPTPVSPAYRGLPVPGAAHPDLYVLACPGLQCGRVEAPDPDAERPPACRVFDRPLRAVGLR